MFRFKKIASVLLALILLAPFAISVFAFPAAPPTPPAPPDWASSAAFANAPYFYGATRITVPIGTAVDLRTGLFRLMAHDVYDGDITHFISRSQDAVNTNTIGTTNITYSVTNSRGQTANRTVQVVVQNRTNLLIERVVYSMPAADTVASEIGGARRGNTHCSQILGIYMPPNSNFRIRTTQSPGGIPTALRVTSYSAIAGTALNNNIGTAWAIISHGNGVTGHGQTITNMGRVPFVRTPRSDTGHFTVEIEITLTGTNSVRGLNYFHHRDNNQATFLSNWTNDHMFAVIASNTVTMMVPWADRVEFGGTTGWINGLSGSGEPSYRMGNINAILDYTNETIELFNYAHGLDIDAPERWNRLIHTRFLVLPQFGGPGAAYYGGDHTAFSSGTTNIAGRPLNQGRTIWSYLRRTHLKAHEYAHGYDGDFSRTREVGLVDITTNVYATFMRRTYAAPNQMWFYDFGRQTRVSLQNSVLAQANGSFNTGFRQGLFLLMTIIEAASNAADVSDLEVWRVMRRLDREFTYNNGAEMSQADLFALSAFYAAGVNMLPYLEWLGFTPTPIVAEYVSGQSNSTPYFLSRLAGGQTVNNIIAQEGLRGPWCAIVANPARNITANATINIQANNFSQISGQTLTLTGGSGNTRQIPITSQTLNVQNLPIGAYTITVSRPGGENLVTGQNVLIVRAASENSATVTFRAAPRIVTEAAEVRFLGGSDVHFATISYDSSRSILNAISHGVRPHWVDALPNPYAAISINGIERLRFAPTATPAARVIEVPVVLGNTADAFHHEGDSRLRMFDTLTSREIWRHNARNQRFIVTEFGLVRDGLTATQRYNDYRTLFNNYLARLREMIPNHLLYDPNSFADSKAMARASLELLNEQDGQNVMDNNAWLFSWGITLPDWGDVDANGTINAEDVTLLRRLIASTARAEFLQRPENNTFSTANADVDGNGYINSADVTRLRMWLAAPPNDRPPLGNLR